MSNKFTVHFDLRSDFEVQFKRTTRDNEYEDKQDFIDSMMRLMGRYTDSNYALKVFHGMVDEGIQAMVDGAGATQTIEMETVNEGDDLARATTVESNVNILETSMTKDFMLILCLSDSE
eukprot:780691_1